METINKSYLVKYVDGFWFEHEIQVSAENENDAEKLHISDVIVSCPECGCDYTYEVGYGFRECFECLNTWKDN
jgi:hypothetical protein